MNHRKFLTASMIAGLIVLCVTPMFLYAADVVRETGTNNNTGSTVVVSSAHWGAIIAGGLTTLALQLLFYTLGAGLGFAAVDPYNRDNPVKGIPMASLIYMVATGLVALFVGGFVGGKLSGATTATTNATAIGGMHGMLVWALSTMVIVWSLTNVAGNVIGGGAKMVVDGLSAVAQGTGAAIGGVAKGAGAVVGGAVHGAGAVAGGAAQGVGSAVQGVGSALGGSAQGILSAVGDKLNLPSFNWDQVKREARNLLREVKGDNKDPNARGGDPLQGDEELTSLLQSMYGQVRDAVNSGDKDELIKVIANRTGKNKEEIKGWVDKAEKTYQDAKAQYQKAVAEAEQKYKEAVAQAEQKAREAAAATASALAQCAIWTFVAMLAGIVAATAGGLTGVSNPDFFRGYF